MVDGLGGGSEKQDAFWHIGNYTKNDAEFYDWARKNPGVLSRNDRDDEPMDHPDGFSTLAQRSKYGEKVNYHDNPTFNFWEDGNGSGSEKADAFYHIEKHAKDSDQFYLRSW